MKEIVTVWCLTYNHAEYIRRTLDGFLIQKTTFPFKIFIFDDASTDGTSEIVREYANIYPQLIEAYISKENFGLAAENRKRRDEIVKCHLNGKYVAWCEGDDYWTDPYKLQIQVDYMEGHPECVMCAHASKWIDYEKNETYEYHPYKIDKDLTDEDVFLRKGGNLTTASILLYKDLNFPDEAYPYTDVGDVSSHWYAVTKGKIHYIDRVMCTYRYCHPGSWGKNQNDSASERISHAVSMSIFLEDYDIYTAGRFNNLVRIIRNNYLNKAIETVADKTEEEIELDLMKDTFDRRKKNRLTQVLSIRKYILNDMATLNESDVDRLRNKQVLVFGTGNYSIYAEKLLNNSKVGYKGYLVSDKNKQNCNKNLPIWDFKDFTANELDTIVVMGVSQVIEDDVIEEIKMLPRVEVMSLFGIEWYS